MGKYLRLLVRNNGYILEQVFSPIVVLGQALLDELRPIASRCVTRHHYHHYRGFYGTQRKLIEKEESKRVKPVLYAYRVLMTGCQRVVGGGAVGAGGTGCVGAAAGLVPSSSGSLSITRCLI